MFRANGGQIEGSAAGKSIVFVVNVSWFFISHRLPIAMEAMRRGYRVHLATQIASKQDRDQLIACGVQLHEIAVVRGSLAIRDDFALTYTLLKLFRRLRPALVHTVTMKPVLFGGIAARLAGVPAMVAAISGLGFSFIAKGFTSRLRRQLLVRGLRIAFRHPNSRVIFQNGDDRQELLSAHAVEPGQTALIRGSGVDTSKYSQATEPTGAVRVLFASRMLREKGVEEFVQAATILRELFPGVQFILAGSADEENPGAISSEQLQRWHTSGVVEWLGFCADMPKLLASVNIVCLPSYYGEGVPKILLEAAAAGRPIVTTDTPGCRDVVTDGVNGLLVLPRDSAGLAKALEILIRDPQMRVRFGHAGRERALAEFELSEVVSSTLNIYDLLIRNA